MSFAVLAAGGSGAAVGVGVAVGELRGAKVPGELDVGVAGSTAGEGVVTGAGVGLEMALAVAEGEGLLGTEGAIATGVDVGGIVAGVVHVIVKAADARTKPATKPSALFLACPLVGTAEIICDLRSERGHGD